MTDYHRRVMRELDVVRDIIRGEPEGVSFDALRERCKARGLDAIAVHGALNVLLANAEIYCPALTTYAIVDPNARVERGRGE